MASLAGLTERRHSRAARIPEEEPCEIALGADTPTTASRFCFKKIGQCRLEYSYALSSPLPNPDEPEPNRGAVEARPTAPLRSRLRSAPRAARVSERRQRGLTSSSIG